MCTRRRRRPGPPSHRGDGQRHHSPASLMQPHAAWSRCRRVTVPGFCARRQTSFGTQPGSTFSRRKRSWTARGTPCRSSGCYGNCGGDGSVTRRRGVRSHSRRAVTVARLLRPDLQARPVQVDDNRPPARNNLHLLLTDLDSSAADGAVVYDAADASHEAARPEARQEADLDQPAYPLPHVDFIGLRVRTAAERRTRSVEHGAIAPCRRPRTTSW